MTQADLFAGGQRGGKQERRRTLLPAPWARVDGGRGTCWGMFEHSSGWQIRHCGHPTALRPYQLFRPDGSEVRAPNGLAWQKLAHAAAEAQRQLEGRPSLTGADVVAMLRAEHAARRRR